MSEQYGGEAAPRLAPVTPLFGARDARHDGARDTAPPAPADENDGGWHATWVAETVDVTRGARDGSDDMVSADADGELQTAVDAAENALLKKLRARSLSVREARSVLRERGLDAASADALIDAFCGRGYLDDAALAEQLVHAGVDRKGEGRRAIAQALVKRGIARDVADAALAELPDDDTQRALEFARTKARSMMSLERDTAVRRLAGQLNRRGYPGSIALTAAKQALDEAGRPAGGVFFR